MHIDFTLTDATKGHLSYTFLKLVPASSNYQLSISGYKESASNNPVTDSHSLNGMSFTTKDRGNDKWGSNCAVSYAGGNAGGW